MTHLLVIFATISQVPADEPKIPADFQIDLVYAPGLSTWKFWKETIRADGNVTRETGYSTHKKVETSSLAPRTVRSLYQTVEAVDFFAIDSRFQASVTDNPTLILKITREGKTHEVSVYAYDHLKSNPQVRRFATLWVQLLKALPSPNKDQTPEIYEEGIGVDGRAQNTDEPRIPADFQIELFYGPGLISTWKPWKETIRADGNVTRETGYSFEKKEESSSLAPRTVRSLYQTVEAVDFFALDSRFRASVTDNPILILKITRDGKTHEVSVYAYDLLKSNPQVRRFARLWSEVLEATPSPNKDQTPDRYREEPAEAPDPAKPTQEPAESAG